MYRHARYACLTSHISTSGRRTASTALQNKSGVTPSTIDTGFILSLARLPNPYDSDKAYQRVLSWYLPPNVQDAVIPHLRKFSDEAVSQRTNDLLSNAETEHPYVKTRNIWGQKYPRDRLVTSEGWKQLGKWGIENGVVAAGYENEFGPHRRIVQHAINYIYSASSAVYSCPVSMTSGAGRLFAKQVEKLPPEHPFHEIYQRIIARQNNWISAQWMTERPGGSDVQNSETIATYSPLPQKSSQWGNVAEGDYLLSGYKYFCSATDCDIALLLAKVAPSKKLSLFVAPTNIVGPDGITYSNGITFHRLKNKLGTNPLPTAELEINNMRAHLVGPLDRGIPTIASSLLNVTRTHNFVTCLSNWRRGMAIAKTFARTRMTMDQPLWLVPMHLRFLATMEVKFQGLLHLAFFTTSLLSYADHGVPTDLPQQSAPTPKDIETLKVVQRTLTALSKAVICKNSCVALQECQEALGGVGFMDESDEPEFNISRLYRDASANMYWEGTTNVLASEVVRHLLAKDHFKLFSAWMSTAVSGVTDVNMQHVLSDSWQRLGRRLDGVSGETEMAGVLGEAREIMFSLSWIVSGILLARDAQRGGDAVAVEVAERWILEGHGGVGESVLRDVVHSRTVGDGLGRNLTEQEQTKWDCRIFWGEELPTNVVALGFRRQAKL